MNRVDTSDEFRRSGRGLVTDVPGARRGAPSEPPVWPPVEDFDFDAHDDRPERLVALKGRVTAGLAVQLLADLATGETYLTLVLDRKTETFPVPADRALDAFDHPYAYGATLPL